MLQRLGQVGREEMFRTFNMGIGFVLIAAPADAGTILDGLRRRREKAFVIGEVTRARRTEAPRVSLA
jgi:phosphoribosylformylglycinamidine cyclo-ligase